MLDSLPWLDNWTILKQLWNPGQTGVPGQELDLSLPGRSLLVRIKDKSGTLIFSKSETDADTAIAVSDLPKAVVSIRLVGSHWRSFSFNDVYTVEVYAYGVLRLSFQLNTGMPPQQTASKNGITLLGSPFGLLSLIGQIPGADVSVVNNLSDGWTRNGRGYWEKTLAPNTPVYGLWVDGYHAIECKYVELASHTSDRAYARVGDTLYYKGVEDLTPMGCLYGITTAHNPYVLDCLKRGTAEVETRTGRKFGKYLNIREAHRTFNQQQQLFPNANPVEVDDHFRIDNFSRHRIIERRYTEADVNSGVIHCETSTGILTLNRSLSSWEQNLDDLAYDRSFNWGDRFSAGENNTELTYIGGFDKPPADIVEAACLIGAIAQAIFWQSSLSQGLSGLSIGCLNLNFGELMSKFIPNWQKRVDQIIAHWHRYEVEVF